MIIELKISYADSFFPLVEAQTQNNLCWLCLFIPSGI